MASVNKAILVGNLGRDPEIRYMPDGNAVCNFSIATTESWKDKQGVKQEKTEWHNIVMYRRLAEIAGEYLKKGRAVYIEGSLQTRKWEKDGVTRYSTEIVANQMQMLGGRSDHASGTPYEDSQVTSADDPSKSTSEPEQAAQQQDTPEQANANNLDNFEDDIPF